MSGGTKEWKKIKEKADAFQALLSHTTRPAHLLSLSQLS